MKITPKWSLKRTKYEQKARKYVPELIYREIFFVKMTRVEILVKIAETNSKHVQPWPAPTQNPICSEHTQFLSFRWRLNSSNYRYFSFSVLPFGLSSAPFLFTKLFCPLVRHWRSLGFHVVLYLDDGIVCEENINAISRAAVVIRNDLVHASIVPDKDKSIWSLVKASNG